MRLASFSLVVSVSLVALACSSSDPAPPNDDGSRLAGGSGSLGAGGSAPAAGGSASNTDAGSAGSSDVPGDDSSNDPGYAPGPFGTAVGGIAQDLSFVGLLNPAGSNYVTTDLAPISFKDFYNPTADASKPTVLVIAASALWCGPCKDEASKSVANWKYWNPKGVQFLTTVFQDLNSNPAQPVDLATWTSNFKLTYPTVIDPDGKMGIFVDYGAIPFNVVLDLKTMKILYAQAGEFDTGPSNAVLKAATAAPQ